jgi:hypothetical protein
MESKERFWVIGGDYECTAFRRVKDAATLVFGPYETRDEARAAWKQVSAEHSSRATVRFGIASEELTLARSA